MKATAVDKFFRDVVRHHVGETPNEKNDLVTVYDPIYPMSGARLQPGPKSPICGKCDLHSHNAVAPYLGPIGDQDPLITFVLEGISPKEDEAGKIAGLGYNGMLKKAVEMVAKDVKFPLDRIRYLPASRCSNRDKKMVNLKPKVGWCRMHMLEDLKYHRPQLICPVGTIVLGALSHKSNANDWAGRVLTYRGWPDDWLTDKKFVLPRPNPLNPEEMIIGHPLFGPMPTLEDHIPMVPVMHPRLVSASQNDFVRAKWMGTIKNALLAAMNGVKPKAYLRDWYHVSDDPDTVAEKLLRLLEMPKLTLCYDTETTGVRPWASDAAIVFMMFRWTDPETGQPDSLGFPWNYEGLDFHNRIQDCIPDLTPLVLEVLYRHDIVGHNITFDVLYTYANLEGADLDRLANAAKWDTWHMVYTLRQRPGTLGLEAITYDFAPDLAGYEENMTLMIQLHHDIMHPEGIVNGRRGHYANCPRDKWDSHLIPYVMGDVETCYTAKDRIQEKLEKSRAYRIPLAHPTIRGKFREYLVPNRDWVYKNVMSPAAAMLMKVMGRGMDVDEEELTHIEGELPRKVAEARNNLRNADQRIGDWCEFMVAKDPTFELDLESKDQLKAILFETLKLPIQRLTKAGKKLYGDDETAYTGLPYETLLEYAALDKFTLNKLAVDHEQVRPLQEYRKIFKLYSTYVRPLRNIMTEGIDKNERTKAQHLCRDGRIHASFLLTGTRGGRLSCRDPNLQQLPREGEVKSMFVSRFTKQGRAGCLYQGDLSQIELRLLAAGCGDASMVKAYFDDVDLHSLTTSRIFKVPYDHFSKDYMKFLQKEGKDKAAKDLDQKRQIGKTVNFLTGYGGGAFGLQTTLAGRSIYLPIEECEKIIESFFDAYPALKKHLQYFKWFIQENGVAVSILGRVRIFEEVYSEDREAISKALRAGCNHLIQSTASDMMLIALIVIEELMREAGLESVLVSTVHDSLLIDALQDELPKIHEIVTLVLNNFDQVLPAYFGPDYDTSWMIVPFAGDCEVGLNYLEQKKVPKTNIDWNELLYPTDKKKKQSS